MENRPVLNGSLPLNTEIKHLWAGGISILSLLTKPTVNLQILTIQRLVDLETPTAKVTVLKSSHCPGQWAWFHRLFASSPQWDFERGVFALKVGPAVWGLYNSTWDKTLIQLQPKWRADTHTPTGNPLFSWRLRSNVLSFQHAEAEWAPEGNAGSDYH